MWLETMGNKENATDKVDGFKSFCIFSQNGNILSCANNTLFAFIKKTAV